MAAMTASWPTVVVGAGPYGLSVAAGLLARRLPAVVFGEPLELWRRMPAGMFLKSSWSASSLWDPDRAYSLDQYAAATGTSPQEPIPLELFQTYCHWFRCHAVPRIEPPRVTSIHGGAGCFRVELSGGHEITARRVVVATGIGRFAHVPGFAAGLPPGLVTHTSGLSDPSTLRGAAVAVIGTGQSALESAALLREAGALVEVIARGPIAWVSRRLYHVHPLVRHLLYAPSDVGPAGVSRLVDRQLLLRRLPGRARHALTWRSVRPAGASWLRPRVEGAIRLTPNTAVCEATPCGRGLRLRLGDGSKRDIDHLVLGTGYRAELDRLGFLSAELRGRVATAGPLPRLDRNFESSVPGLHFVGALAEHDFGPLCRFVAGAALAGRQVSRRAAEDVTR